MNEKGINVLDEYGLEILNVRKGRGMLLVETKKEPKIS